MSVHICQEVLTMIGEKYIRCEVPAFTLVKHRGRDEGPYWMCPEHAGHNIHNRGGEDVTPKIPEPKTVRLPIELKIVITIPEELDNRLQEGDEEAHDLLGDQITDALAERFPGVEVTVEGMGEFNVQIEDNNPLHRRDR